MANEAFKTNLLRGEEFIRRYFGGKVIDIGCGHDRVTPQAEAFDLMFGDGDAGNILNYRQAETYDCVHSSHCLEHMTDVPFALRQWWKLVKPGGYMVVVVPEEDLYEQGVWPSHFNKDHKATFRLNRQSGWSKNSYDMLDLVKELPDSKIISAEIQDRSYNYFLKRKGLPKLNSVQIRTYDFLRRFMKKRKMRIRYLSLLDYLFGFPVDQTTGRALAQIQIVLQKNKDGGPAI